MPFWKKGPEVPSFIPDPQGENVGFEANKSVVESVSKPIP